MIFILSIISLSCILCTYLFLSSFTKIEKLQSSISLGSSNTQTNLNNYILKVSDRLIWFKDKLSIYKDYQSLNLDIEVLNRDISIALIAVFAFIFLSILKLQILALASILFASYKIITIIENPKQQLNIINKNIYHFLLSLKILCVKNQLPLLQAIGIIEKQYKDNFTLFLSKLKEDLELCSIEQIQDSIPEQIDYSMDIKNFILCLSTNTSNNQATKLFEKIDNKITLDQRLKKDNLIENIQLYLAVPVTVLMMVASYPLFTAINFSLQKVNLQ